MTTFTTELSQQDVLNSVKAYFGRIHENGDANTAFCGITRDLAN